MVPAPQLHGHAVAVLLDRLDRRGVAVAFKVHGPSDMAKVVKEVEPVFHATHRWSSFSGNLDEQRNRAFA